MTIRILPTKDGRELSIDFDKAASAALRVAKVCADMAYVPPEAHDVVAVNLRRLAAMMDEVATALRLKVSAIDRQETQQSVTEWANMTFGIPATNVRVATRANEEMAELLKALSADDASLQAAAEIADVVIVLYRLATRLGVDLLDEIDRKMATNRQRQWNVGVDGHGYHVKSTEVAK